MNKFLNIFYVLIYKIIYMFLFHAKNKKIINFMEKKYFFMFFYKNLYFLLN